MTNTEEPRPGSWAAVDQDSARFRGLLEEYDNDYQKATDAYLRGEEPTERGGGSANPM
jgi:hypothetical protein